ncbi:MAG: aldo/keto reductase [Bacteroidetes bacterium]|nr:MAG: aldo/keto reductase [Bacteroidota bacterium]
MVPKVKIAEGGPGFSRLVFGTMNWGVWGANLSAREMLSLIHKSHDLGVTTFDHADIYGHYTTEGTFGEALARNPSIRQNLQIVTKCGIRLITPNRPFNRVHSYDTSRRHILLSVENSLRELHTDYIDLLLIHRPSPLMDPDEIAEAFEQLKKSGKVLHFGVSNFTPAQFNMLQSRVPLVTNQVEASAIHLAPFLDGTFDQCLEKRIKPMVWSPLGGGKIFTDSDDPRNARIRKIAAQIGARHGDFSLDQVLIAWLLKHPAGILPVVGTSKFERLAAAVGAQKLEMTDEEWFEIWIASTGKPVP